MLDKAERDYFLYGVLKSMMVMPGVRRNSDYIFDYKI